MKLSRQKIYSLIFAAFAILLMVMYFMQPEWNKAKAGGIGFSILILAFAVVTFIRDGRKDDDTKQQ